VIHLHGHCGQHGPGLHEHDHDHELDLYVSVA
jgi:hypothetical protein